MVFLILILNLLSPFDVNYLNKCFSSYFVTTSGLSLSIADTSSLWVVTLSEKNLYGFSLKNYCEFCHDSAINPLGFYFGKVQNNRFLGSSLDYGFFSRESSYYGDLLSNNRHIFIKPQFYFSWTGLKNKNLIKFSFPVYRLNYQTPTDTCRILAYQYKFSYMTKYDFTSQWFALGEFFIGKTIKKSSYKTIQQFSDFDSSFSSFILGGDFRLFYNPFSRTFISPAVLLSSYGDSLNVNLLLSGFYEISSHFGLISDLEFELNSKSTSVSSTELSVRRMYWRTANLGLRFSKEFLSLDFLFDPFKRSFLLFTLQIRFAS